MKLRQLSDVKHRLRLHGGRRPMELHAWDTVVMLWLLGWVGSTAAALLQRMEMLPACALLCWAPDLYAALRRRLHRRGRLRCDWLDLAR